MIRPQLPGSFMRRSAAFAAVLLGAFGGLAVQLARIHLGGHAEAVQAAASQGYAVIRMPGIRGTILDSSGAALAVSLPARTVCADLSAIRDPKAAAEALAPVLKMPAGEIERRLSEKSRGWIYLKRRVDPEIADAIRDLKIPGIVFEREGRRVYPLRSTAAHAIGFAGADDIGLEGLEKTMDVFLRGENGFVRLRKDASGRLLALSANDVLSEPPSRGLTVHLTLDSTIQLIAEAELAKMASQYRAKGATAIVMDVESGAILAMACIPAYDAQRPGSVPPEYRRNRAITDVYEPGSTNKTFIVAWALEKGRIGPETPIFCENGAWRIGYRTLHDVHAYGALPVSMVIAKSSNIGAAKIGLLLGIDRVYEAERLFGFGEPTGIELPGEAGGILRPRRFWKNDSVVSVSIGQEVAVTPIQLVRAYAAVANGGWLLRPRIVSHMSDVDGNIVKKTSREVVRRVISQQTSDIMREMLVKAVEDGTGKSAKCDLYSIGGKTGTAQKAIGGTYSREAYVASFCGFAPAEKPVLVCLVTCDEPSKGIGYYGGTVAAPTASAILRRSLLHLGVTPRPLQQDKTIPNIASVSAAVPATRAASSIARVAPSSSSAVPASERR